MKYRLLTFLLLFLSLWAQAQNVRLTGKVTDLAGKPIPGVSIAVVGTLMGTVTSPAGDYSLTLAPGEYRVQYSFVGYASQVLSISVKDVDVLSDVTLVESSQTLTDVTIVGSRSTQIRSSVETVVPIDVITSQDLQATGQIEPTQMMNLVAPSFNSARKTVADGTVHIDPATLRGLGPDQVLTLLNGKRRHNQALT
ncbi:MAG: carboxypeptidase-like regulatory domain-containing protein, partial [Verrucomicrobia bacterium]|nr:carboxypeptidase-like regulatory domain-containing protein [Cytophagales bacterium]